MNLNDCIYDYISEQPPAPAEEEAPLGGLADAEIDSNWDEAIETFDGLELPEELLRGIYAYGFEKPSAIQQRAIKPTMLGRDLIAQAQSGTVRHYFYILSPHEKLITRDDDFEKTPSFESE